MGLTFYDVANNDTPITTWEELVLVVSFEVKNGTSYNNNTQYFGFDSVKLNNNGKITHLHDIHLNKNTHIYAEGTDYEPIAGNENKRDDFLEKEFKIFSTGSGSNKKYSAQSWVHLPGLNLPIDNLKMKFAGTYQNVPLTFEIPEGIILKYKFAANFTEIENGVPVSFTTNDVQISLEATSAVGEVEINVKDQGKRIIGSLGIYAFDRIALDVHLWSVVENPNGSKTKPQIQSAHQSLMYSNTEQSRLKEKLDKVFHQAGVNITLHDAGTITYDPNSNDYKNIVSNKSIDSKENGRLFFEALITNNPQMKAKTGTNLMILDASCALLGGLGRIGNKYSTVFNQSRTDYGVCAHEIGHTLGLIHSFYETEKTKEIITESKKELNRLNNGLRGSLDLIIFDLKGIPKEIDAYLLEHESDKEVYEPIRSKLEQYLKLTEDEERVNNIIVSKYIKWKGFDNDPSIKEINEKIKKEILLLSSVILFEKRETKNLMDYNENNYNYLFKYQWKCIRAYTK